MTTLYRSWLKANPGGDVKVLDKEDPEFLALEAGVHALQAQKATGRCVQVVVKRRNELSSHSRRVLDAYLRGVEVPGYRMGKAPPDRMVQIVAKFPGYERAMFRRCFTYWMELNAGLPERVADAGRKAAPGIDFATADWSEIAEAARPIGSRMPQQVREDILLSLFACRFGSFILGPCVCENCAKRKEEDGGALEDATAGSSNGEDGGSSDLMNDSSNDAALDKSTSEAIEGRQLDAASQTCVAALQGLLTDLARIEATSPVWDIEVDAFLQRVASLRASKIADREAVDARNDLAAALAQLLEPAQFDELMFLRVNDVARAWSVAGISNDRARTLSPRIATLNADVAAHRVARIAAQHASHDEDFETFTTQRKTAKERILASIRELSPLFSSGSLDTPGGTWVSESSPAIILTASSPALALDELVVAPEEHTIATEAPQADENRAGPPEVVDVGKGPAMCGPSEQSPVPNIATSDGGVEAAQATPVETHRPEVKNDETTLTSAVDLRNTKISGTVAADVPAMDRDDGDSEPAVPVVSRTSTAELGVGALLELPIELTSYEDFRDHFWTGPNQTVERAPWKDPGFAERLGATAASALPNGPSRTWELFTVCRALEQLGGDALMSTADIRASAALWISPRSASAGLDPDRCERIRSGKAPFGSTQQRVALVLECLRPSAERQLLLHEIDTLIDHAGFQSGALRVAVQRFLTASAQGYDPIHLAQRSTRAAAHQGQEVALRFAAARKDLQTLVTRVWNSAGGKIQRTHCRHAWSEFIEKIQPSLSRLYPAPRGDDGWGPADLAKHIDGYPALLEDICDRFGAKFDDKRRMLRTAGEIADAALRVIELRREQLSVDDGRRPPFAMPELELEQLRETRLDEPGEEFARQILVRALAPTIDEGEGHPLAITIQDLCARPDLLRVIRDVPPESIEALGRPTGAVAYADELPDAVRAASMVLQAPEIADPATLEGLIARLERTQRGALLGLVVQALDERLQKRVHAERTDALGRLATSVSQISKVVDDLGQLGNRFASAMQAVRDRARELIENDNIRLDTRLIEAWLDRVLDMGQGLVQRHVEQLSLEAAKREEAEEIQAALTRAHYGRAIRLLQGHAGSELRTTRQTEWRDDVEGNRDALQRTLYGLTDRTLKPLLDAWRVGVKGDAVRADRTLRTEFVKMITDGRNMDRASEPSFIAIPMSAIQAELSHDQLMPTWLPQLSRFGRLAILTPPVSPEQPSFKQGALTKLGEFQQDLVVLLTPRLPAGRRTEILAEMRRRGAAAAVLDDVDLIRLINPGGQRPHQMLGTLEIIFEQQRRGVYSPFELPEGSNVRLEMYVGRRDKARELARTANYSRLFSGRKLGKSALLRFMESNEGGVKLPSGNALRVLYVPAVGIESEATMVEAIVSTLEAAAATRLERPTDGEPSDKLSAIVSRYLADHRSESLLLVLDEADVFFERQLAEYEERRERCLSFQMRSRFSSLTDEHGLPRVRFIFAGYRVTNRSQGAWSNWGRVLSLDPLEPEDAARLISGPLAVMGIDVGAHAHEIAYRCGYQPAILLRFGERLMDHLERQPHRGEHYVVTAADIAQVLDDQRVHDEIRTIARNNFEGNPVGLIVFSAFLRELLELPPGQPLRDAPQRIVERLRKIDADLGWLERDGDGSATVRGYLADFVERYLLRERRGIDGEPSYSLRFPHHLTILANLADGARIRDELRRVRFRSEGAADDVERALVAPRVLRDLTDASQTNSKAIAIVGTLWSKGTYDRSGGIPDRLGATPDETVDAHRVFDGQVPLGRVRAVRRTDIAVAEQILSETHAAPARPTLVGGVDLLRWGIQRRRASTDLLFEVHGVGRLSMARLTWWFQRVRGLEFARTDALERIHSRTGGVPMLVEAVDDHLVTVAGTTVSDDRVNLALGALDETIVTVARQLVNGPPAYVLQAREREILQMIECVLRIDPSAGTDLASALTEVWDLFADQCAIAPLASTDSVPLEVLLELGFLPAKSPSAWEDPLTRLGTVEAADPIFKVVRAFPGQPRQG